MAEPIKNWKVDRLGDLSGKTYVITGANSGIGFEAARHLRNAGADVVVAARSEAKCAGAIERLTDGAVPEVLAAAGAEARNGAYYGPTRFGDTRGPVGESTVAKAAKDEVAAARLWDVSQELLGIDWTF